MTEWTEAMTGNGCTWIERDEVFEDYARGTLGDEARDAFETHYFACDPCFHKVYTSLALRAELAALPGAEPAPEPAPRRSWWLIVAPVAATAVVVIAAALWFRNPALPASPAIVADAPPATAPAAAPAMPTPADASAGHSAVSRAAPVTGSRAREAVRNTPPAASALMLLSPSDNQVLPIERLDLSWRHVPGVVYYDFQIVTEEGNVVWSGRADGTSSTLPAGHGLQAGQKYFVWVRAHLSGGGTVKSPAVPFRVSGQ
jgi:hypothetical protein